MSTPRFYCARMLAAGLTMTLPAETFHHAVRVRRLREGDALILFSGDGREALAVLVGVSRDAGEVAISSLNAVSRESPLRLTLLQGLSTADRMDYTLQKAVELGVATIMPVLAQRSIVRLDRERADKRAAHWRQIVVSACEQCGRNVIPEVMPLLPLEAALAALGLRHGYILSLNGGAQMRDLPLPGGPIALLAGPEGGLTDEEESAARGSGFKPISLGPRILRTETAGVAALAAMQAVWGDG